MPALNKSERVIANAESVLKALNIDLNAEVFKTNSYVAIHKTPEKWGEIKDKLNAIIEIMEK